MSFFFCITKNVKNSTSCFTIIPNLEHSLALAKCVRNATFQRYSFWSLEFQKLKPFFVHQGLAIWNGLAENLLIALTLLIFLLLSHLESGKNVYNAIFNSNYAQWQMMRAFSLRLRDLGYFFPVCFFLLSA